MHKKKIEEIRGWLELQKQPGLRCKAPRVLVLTGGHRLLYCYIFPKP